MFIIKRGWGHREASSQLASDNFQHTNFLSTGSQHCFYEIQLIIICLELPALIIGHSLNFRTGVCDAFIPIVCIKHDGVNPRYSVFDQILFIGWIHHFKSSLCQ